MENKLKEYQYLKQDTAACLPSIFKQGRFASVHKILLCTVSVDYKHTDVLRTCSDMSICFILTESTAGQMLKTLSVCISNNLHRLAGCLAPAVYSKHFHNQNSKNANMMAALCFFTQCCDST